MIIAYPVLEVYSAEKEAAPVSTGLDQSVIDQYQAQSEGEGYDNYVEPK
ncbi:hypothetical protein [Novipirellula rosea]|uniref:Uncharacterized protein n=1 Tax=Novipirellula rosea TaxID=1031540 RepID=A0ABP8NIH9_9BACT